MDKPNFKAQLLGYNKQQVQDHIAKLSYNYNTQLQALQSELRESEKDHAAALSAAKYEFAQKELALRSQIERLTADQAALDQERKVISAALTDAHTYANHLRLVADENAKAMSVKNQAACDEQKKHIEDFESRLAVVVSAVRTLFEPLKELSGIANELEQLKADIDAEKDNITPVLFCSDDEKAEESPLSVADESAPAVVEAADACVEEDTDDFPVELFKLAGNDEAEDEESDPGLANQWMHTIPC